MRDRYTQLYQVNEEVIRNHKLFCNNHEELLRILKKLNLTIQHASRLRGNVQSSIVSASLNTFYAIFVSIRFPALRIDVIVKLVMIHFAVGKNKSEIISQCRQAIATNNLNELIKLIKTGRD